jgi:hypothetical protein
MTISYVYRYYGHDDHRTPPAQLAEAAERAVPMLHPQRAHTLTCKDLAPYSLTRQPAQSNPAWIVTFTPEPEQEDPR